MKYDTEDVEHLKALIEKVGGPPPQLIKFAEKRGYVTRQEVVGKALSNDQLERMLDRRAALEAATSREENRKEMVRKQMAKLDAPAKEESELAELAEIMKEREEQKMRIMMEKLSFEDVVETEKEDNKEYEKKREELQCGQVD